MRPTGRDNDTWSKRLAQLLNKIWRQGERVLFWALALLYLVPVWAYRYIPTQDGPSHLDNAQILKDLGISSIRLLTSADHHYVGLAGFGIELAASEPIE